MILQSGGSSGMEESRMDVKQRYSNTIHLGRYDTYISGRRTNGVQVACQDNDGRTRALASHSIE